MNPRSFRKGQQLKSERSGGPIKSDLGPGGRLLLMTVDVSHAHQPQLTATHQERHSASVDFMVSSPSTCSAVFRFAPVSLGMWHTGSSAAQTELYPILSLSLPSAGFTLFKGETFKPRHVASPKSRLATHSYYFSKPSPPPFFLLHFQALFSSSRHPNRRNTRSHFLPSLRAHTPEGLIRPREKKGKEGKHNETGREVERKGREGKGEETGSGEGG